MFLWFPVLDLARAPRRTARKKGSGYENGANQDRVTFKLLCTLILVWSMSNLTDQAWNFLHL